VQCLPDDPDTIVNIGCCLFKEGKYEEARVKFSEAQQALGAGHADLAYNISLCYYRLKQYGKVLQHIAEIIETVTNLHADAPLASGSDLQYGVTEPAAGAYLDADLGPALGCRCRRACESTPSSR
jgi:tetratricopeptide (TPR) repeat protein